MSNCTKVSRSCCGKIIVGKDNGMGGFLNPPGHPEHNHSVKSVYGNTFYMSLSAAVESTWLDSGTRAKAKGILSRWARTKRPLNSPSVQDWIGEVLAYFNKCYQGENGAWDVGHLFIDKKETLDPWVYQDQHAGVHFIRGFYPEYEALPEDFTRGKWGCK